jgi:hypothetical protein
MELIREYALSAVVVAACVVVVSGCGRRPHPPALQENNGLYRNSREGLSLHPPPEWRQFGRAISPDADGSHESELVKYKRLTGKPAFFQVFVMELAPSADLAEFLAGHSPGKEWHRQGNTETLTVGDLPALRDSFSGTWDRQGVVREIVAVHRGKRLYLFKGTFPVDDKEAQTLVRQAVASAVWEGDAKN